MNNYTAADLMICTLAMLGGIFAFIVITMVTVGLW